MTTERGTSRTLLRRAGGGDQHAWREMVAEYAPLVRHWCRRWGLQPADADDITQDVFTAVHGGLAGFRKEGPLDTFRGWLRGVARHKLLGFHRQAARRPDPLPEAVAAPEARSAVTRPLQADERVRTALARVRPDFRADTWRAFWAVAVDGRAVADVAAELGVSANAVRVARCRVLQRLRAELS